jgi:3-mercaptopyruvate sulfurtransferase SseA
VALQLHRRGIRRVRPLLGGLDAWEQQGFPLQKIKVAESAMAQPSGIA